MRWFLRSKIHNARVTESDVNYIGSIGIDEDLLEKTGMLVGERVLVVSNSTGVRLETYIIAEPAGSGRVTMNGGAAHLIGAGEKIIIMGFELADQAPAARVVLVTDSNRFQAYL